jgi:drug/metabolite transporter (DMT)-like permease
VRGATGSGFVAIALWGTSIAVGRLIMGEVGLLLGPLIISIASGTVGTAILVLRPGERAKLRSLPPRYWAVCGSLFVVYNVAYNLGVGLASDGRQLLVFGMLNYLWPVLTVLLSALIFHRRVRPWLALGLSLALGGIALAFLARPPGAAGAGLAAGLPMGLSFRGVLADVAAHPLVYGLGLCCGIAWALYSNLGKLIAGANEADPVPLLFLGTSLVYLTLYLAGAFPGQGSLAAAGPAAATWTLVGIGALLYRALVVDLLAYVLWDRAMRRGDQLLVAAGSFFTPLLSTACVALALGVRPGSLFWIAGLLLVAGAAISRFSVHGGDP